MADRRGKHGSLGKPLALAPPSVPLVGGARDSVVTAEAGRPILATPGGNEVFPTPGDNRDR